MQFLNPSGFYLLFTIPLVVALHFLKLRRQTYLVPSLMLWRSAAEDRKANVPFQRLRNYLPLLLQVLFLILLTLSVARPVLYRPGFMQGKAILIIDNSASMQSTEMGKTRLELAKEEALRLIRDVSASGGMMVLVTQAAENYIQQAFTTDAEKLHQAVKNIAPTDAVSSLGPAFAAVAHYADSTQDRVFFISDSFHNLPEIALPLHKISVGSEAENVGIVQFRLELEAQEYLVLISIHNWTDTLIELNVALKVEGNLLDEKPELVPVPAGKTQPVLFSGDATGLEGLVISAHLEVVDDFLLDNTASALLLTQPPFQIELVSNREHPLLIPLLRTYGSHVKLRQVSTGAYHGSRETDVTIFDQFAPDTVPMRAVIFLNPTVVEDGYLLPPNVNVVETETRRTPTKPDGHGATTQLQTTARKSVQVIEQDKTHPVMRGISLIGVPLSRAEARELPNWARSLVETEKGALIWLGNDVGNRQLIVFEFDAFNPEISRFALTIPTVPQFIYQCLTWLEAGSAPIQPLVYREDATPHAFHTGESVRIAFSSGETSDIRVLKPDGVTVELTGSVFTQTDLIGTYSVFAGDVLVERFTVNLLNPAESALSSPSTVPVDLEETAGRTPLQPIQQEVWRWLLLIAFLLLLLEWWCYHRSAS